MTITSFVLHTTSTAILGYGLANTAYGDSPVDRWIQTQYAGHYQFLTILGVLIACSSMVLGVVFDLTGSRRIKSWKRGLMMMAMPIEAVVASVYWSLLIFAPSLILLHDNQTTVTDAAADATAAVSSMATIPPPPFPVDLALHAVPGLALVLDFLFFEDKFTGATEDMAGSIVCMCTAVYASWAERCAVRNGAFPYPFLTMSNFEARLGIYTGATLIAYWSFCILNAVHA